MMSVTLLVLDLKNPSGYKKKSSTGNPPSKEMLSSSSLQNKLFLLSSLKNFTKTTLQIALWRDSFGEIICPKHHCHPSYDKHGPSLCHPKK